MSAEFLFLCSHQLQSDAVTCQVGYCQGWIFTLAGQLCHRNYYFSPVFSFLSLFYFPCIFQHSIELDFSRVVRQSIIIRLNDCACRAYVHAGQITCLIHSPTLLLNSITQCVSTHVRSIINWIIIHVVSPCISDF